MDRKFLSHRGRREGECIAMRRKLTFAFVLFLLCLAAALPALAADVFRFADESVTVWDGDTVTPELLRDGQYADGQVSFWSRGSNCSVDENGTITGLEPGQAYVQADLIRDGKKVRYASILVKVVRRARKIEITDNVQIYEHDDPKILPLLTPGPEGELPEKQILVVPAGKAIWFHTKITPDDVPNKRMALVTTDPAVAKITRDGQFIAVGAGECELTVSSVQNPEVTQEFHVLVIQPVTRVDITYGAKSVAAGKTLQLGTTVIPADAAIQDVTWRSREPNTATVDANGLVTGVSRGDVVIEATTMDGSNLTATFYLTVTQDVTSVDIEETEVLVAAGERSRQLHVTALPANANNRRVTWSSSDETVATVKDGWVTGLRRGECTVTCASESNPEVIETIPVRVIQKVTDITMLTPQGLSFHIGESRQLQWAVFPQDADIQTVTFTSRAPQIATVDQNGIVTGLAKGQADIVVSATDGSGKSSTFRVSILKPVEGIEPLPAQYYAQIGWSTNIRANAYPSDASNLRILWSSSDEYIGSVTSDGTAYGRISGRNRGWFTVTATTEDGGYSTSTNVMVDDFDGMVMAGGAYIDSNNKIRLTFWNVGRDFSVRQVYFRIDAYDTQGYPMVCNKDGVSTSFEGTYPLTLAPGACTEHGRFSFHNYQTTGLYGYVVVTITGYEFDNGQKWWIPEDKQIHQPSVFSEHWGEPTPVPPEAPEESNG